MGEPFCESLTSYITRLATAHCVSNRVLLKYILSFSKAIDKNRADRGLLIKNGAKSFNGYNTYAQEIAGVLSKLTLVQDIEMLTMFPWRNAFDLYGNGLFKENKEWCQICFHDYKKQYRNVCEPLIWYLNNYKVCHIHHCPLTDRCQLCGNHQPFLSSYPHLGYCATCGADLSSKSSILHKKDGLQREVGSIDYAELIIKLLSNKNLGKKASQEIFVKNIERIILLTTNGNAQKLEELLGLGNSTVSQWRRGRFRPKFDSILEFAYKIRVNIIDLLCGEVKNVQMPCEQFERNISEDYTKSRNHDEIETKLNKIISTNAPISFKETARLLEVSLGYLNYRFSQYKNTIVQNYKVFKKKEIDLRNKAMAKRVRAAVNLLNKSGIYPSQRKVFNEKYGLKSIDRLNKKLIEAWRKAVQELGYE